MPLNIWIYRPDKVMQERIKEFLYTSNGVSYNRVKELEEEAKNKLLHPQFKKDYQIEIRD